MRYFVQQRRQRMVERLTRDLPEDVRGCTRAAMLLTYTDEQLRATDQRKYSRRTLRDLPERIIDRLDTDEAYDLYSAEMTHFYDVNNHINDLIGAYCRRGRAADYTARLETLAAAINRVKIKYGDPSKDGYQSAMNSGAEIALKVQTSLGFGHAALKDGAETQLTPAQEEGIVAVQFLLLQSGDDMFYPLFPSDNTTSYGWLTTKIMDTPDDAEGNLAAYRARMERWSEVEAKLINGYPGMSDHNVLCDYPDELIDRLAQIMKDDYRLWEELSRYVISVNGGNSHHTMNEVLYFMGPYRSQFNIRYIAGTIPSVLRAYNSLPPMDDYSSASEDVRDQCAALLLVSIAIATKLNGTAQPAFLNDDRTIKDHRLIDLLMAHPERGEEIAAAIEERQTADFDLLNDITSSVIGEGTL